MIHPGDSLTGERKELVTPAISRNLKSHIQPGVAENILKEHLFYSKYDKKIEKKKQLRRNFAKQMAGSSFPTGFSTKNGFQK
ncbi:MAG: hypothetical protein HY774_16135 [Acidobacteria bacterium]|nr:hypothetical protein [Acidobacteriota bacterium]